MKMLVSLAAATILSALFVIPAAAQPQFQFGIDERGRPQFGIRDPERERWERRRYWRERREWERQQAYEQGRRDVYRGAQGYGIYGGSRRCRTLLITEEDDWGRTIQRRVRRCR